MNVVNPQVVKIIALERMGFNAAFNIQMHFAQAHFDYLSGKRAAPADNVLLLVEHPPVYTVGIRTKGYSHEDEVRLKNSGAEFCKTNRGGLITFHGPGQLVAYPIINLKLFKPSMKWYVCQLEKTLIKTLNKFDIEGRTTDQTGVWVKDKKIASIGLHGSRYITTHGVSLNCATDLSWFEHIVPCGLQGVQMTSVSQELQRPVSLHDAIEPFLLSFHEVFNCPMEHQELDLGELVFLTSSDNSSTNGTKEGSINHNTNNNKDINSNNINNIDNINNTYSHTSKINTEEDKMEEYMQPKTIKQNIIDRVRTFITRIFR